MVSQDLSQMIGTADLQGDGAEQGGCCVLIIRMLSRWHHTKQIRWRFDEAFGLTEPRKPPSPSSTVGLAEKRSVRGH